MNDSRIPLLSQVKKQVWKWNGQYSQLTVNCLTNTPIMLKNKGCKRTFREIIIGQLGQ